MIRNFCWPIQIVLCNYSLNTGFQYKYTAPTQLSEELSAEVEPTIYKVVPRLYNLSQFLHGIRVKGTNQVSKRFAAILIKLLEERFPKCGSENYYYAAATILHPFYQGMALYDLGTQHSTMERFVKENDQSDEKDDLNSAHLMDLEEDDMSIEALTQRAKAKRAHFDAGSEAPTQPWQGVIRISVSKPDF